MALPYKLGTHQTGAGIVPYRHPVAYARVDGSMRISPASVELLLDLLPESEGEFGLEYVLLDGPEHFPAGRYARPLPVPKNELAEWLARHRDFLELDARHHVRVAGERVVLEINPHDWIVASGELSEIEQILLQKGIAEGTVDLPYPHSHHIWPEFDERVGVILSDAPWNWAALQESD